jgi:hypothetical protein
MELTGSVFALHYSGTAAPCQAKVSLFYAKISQIAQKQLDKPRVKRYPIQG